jgi:hypothetical protein
MQPKILKVNELVAEAIGVPRQNSKHV